MVGGRTIVENDVLISAPQDEIGRAGADAHRRLMTLAQDVL